MRKELVSRDDCWVDLPKESFFPIQLLAKLAPILFSPSPKNDRANKTNIYNVQGLRRKKKKKEPLKNCLL